MCSCPAAVLKKALKLIVPSRRPVIRSRADLSMPVTSSAARVVSIVPMLPTSPLMS